MIDKRTAPYGALLIRVALGLLFIAHGLLKVLVFTIPGTVKFFAAIGYPGFVAYLVIFAELAGGSAFILGLWTRWVAIVLFVEMLGIVAFHFSHGWIFTAKGGGWKYPALWAVALVALALLGDGAASISRRRKPGY